jgi:hypothetical protein
MKSIHCTEKEQKMIDAWIAEMQDAGLSYDNMIAVFQEAKMKLNFMLESNKTKMNLKNWQKAKLIMDTIELPQSLSVNDIQYCEQCQSWYDYLTTQCCPCCGN